MDLNALRCFLAVADTLHFGRAAARLHMSQPPLSRRIAALEIELGVILFERSSRSVRLTTAGHDLRTNAARIVDQLHSAADSARACAAGHRGRLQIGFAMYAAWNVLPELVRRYDRQSPAVTLELEETLPKHLQTALSEGAIDAGIGFPAPLSSRIRYRAMYREALCVALPRDHALAHGRRVAVADLAPEAFVTFPRSTAPALHAAVTRCCEAQGFAPRIRLETHLQQTIVNLVAAGLGVALVPTSMRRMRLPGAVFKPLDAPTHIEQGIYWHVGNRNPCLPGLLAYAEALADEAAN